MKKWFSMALLGALITTLIPGLAGASPDVLDGANADFDYVYMDEDVTHNFTDEASDTDKDPVKVFPDDDGEKQYLYLGSKSQFDRAYFKIILPAQYENHDRDLIWEYYKDGNWKTLNASDSYIDGFTNKGVYYVQWSIPSGWDKLTYQSKSAYWVRVRPTDTVEKGAIVEQISVRTYNLEINVEDEDNDEVDDLTASDFHFSGGSDNQVYGFQNRGDGEYWFALNAEASDTSYKLEIDDSRYDEKTITISSLDTSVDSYNVELDDDYDPPVYPADDDLPFRDLDDVSWAVSAIEDLYERGVVQGRSYYYYYPEDEVTRAEFLKMILLSAEIDIEDYDDEDEDFRDVANYDWFYEYVQAGLALDLIDDDYYFYPDADINRAEAVTMLVRLQDELHNVNLDEDDTPFWDVSRYDWFAEYVAYAYDEDIINGYYDNSFRPDNELNRAEAAVLADRAYDEWWD